MRDEWQIDCSDHGPGVQWLQHGRNLREFTLLVPIVPVGVNSPGSMQTKPKPKKTTCNTSQLSKSIGSMDSGIDVTTPWRPPQCATPRVPNPFCLCGFGT